MNQTPNGNYSSDPRYLIEFDGAVFFAANPNDNGNTSAAETRYSGLLVGEELFTLSCDEEVSLFADLNPGFSSSYPRDLVVFNDSLYFIADTESSRVGLYRLNNRFAQP